MAKKFSFSRKVRIFTEEGFNRIFRVAYEKTRKVKTSCFSVFFQKNSFSYPRLGISISKSQVQNAVRRNRLKRLSREVFRLNQHVLDNLDIILVIYKDADQLSNEKWRNILEKHLTKLANF